jgi:hypothetical protein
MGRNSKRKAERRTIRLTGEQAKVFDAQMDSDRDWFKGSRQGVRFRPEIDGEFDHQLALGQQPNCIRCFDPETGKATTASLGWVCVVDIGQALGADGPSGWRTRLRCPPPISGRIRQEMASSAIAFAIAAVGALRKQHQQQNAANKPQVEL